MLDNDAYAPPTRMAGKGHSAERTLRSAIVHGVLLPGQRLSEVGLAQEFAFGRGAVRAALARLQMGGFVSASARSGWSVAPISAGEIREVVSARRQLEPLLGSVILNEFDRGRLERLSDMHAALTQRDDHGGDVLSTIRRYDRDLLDFLVDRLAMPVVAGCLSDLWDRSDRLVLFFESRGSARLAPADMPRLVQELVAGRSAEAKAQVANAVDALESFLTTRFLESEATVGKPAGRRMSARQAPSTKPSKQTRSSTITGSLDDV